jgi:amino acid adenylation domain-containing protein
MTVTLIYIAEGLLHELFERQAKKTPEAMAVITTQRSLTYQELYTRSLHLAHQLRSLGAGPNKLVALVTQKGWEQLVGIFAILFAGAGYLPIDSELPQERLLLILESAEVEIVLSQTPVANTITLPFHLKVFLLDTLQAPESPVEPLPTLQKSTDLAYTIFTSGSTGVPKGVMIEHHSVLNLVQYWNSKILIGPQDRIIGVSSLSFDLSVYDVFGSMTSGAALVIPDAGREKDPSHWAELVEKYQVSFWNSVPAIVELYVDFMTPNPIPSSLKNIVMSGDFIPINLPTSTTFQLLNTNIFPDIRKLSASVNIIGSGGPTETTVWSVYYPIDADASYTSSIPLGKPTSNTKHLILDKNGDTCPVYVTGEMYTSGEGVARGYWKDETLTNSKFRNYRGMRTFNTGDLARYLPDGNIEIIGRKDFQIKIQGYRIETRDIESAIMRHTQIQETVVAAVDVAKKKSLAAFVVVKVEKPKEDTTIAIKMAGLNLRNQVTETSQVLTKTDDKVSILIKHILIHV